MSLLIFTFFLFHIIIILERYGVNMEENQIDYSKYNDKEIAFRIIITFIEGLIASVLSSIPYLQENPSKETIRIVFISGVCMGVSAVINIIKAIIERY